MRFYKPYTCLVLLPFLTLCSKLAAQDAITNSSKKKKTVASHSLRAIAGNDADLFGLRGRYIKNIGQYGDTVAKQGRMGKVLYGYEGIGMPVLFTSKGVIHIHRKTKKISYEQREKSEREDVKKEEIRKRNASTERAISIEWLNANPRPEIIATDAAEGYHIYGMLPEKAMAFKKIVYKELYPGIDAEYSFIQSEKPGYEFSLVIRPGADVSRVKMRYAGDISSININAEGNLVINSDIDGFVQSMPVSYYAENKNERIATSYSLKGNVISFRLPAGYDESRTFIIDPFVTGTATLSGANSGIAKDIDFDYAGNVYVSGGGDGSIQKLAKFDAAGTLQWTFTGSVTTPFWVFGGSYGGWVVDKVTGNIYLGQGLAGSGFAVIRLTTAGVYDNYLTTSNSNFAENWKMIWSCNGGTPKMLIAGGGGSANNELALLAPPSVVPATSNLSGLTGGHNDISDIVIDPVTNDMFTIFSTPVTSTTTDNTIYKHPPPYSSASISWRTFTGYFALQEPRNRPYLTGLDNSSNTLAVSSAYLFYWDGRNLKAFDKATGAAVGTPFSIPSNVFLLQGGVFADECNNVFIGFTNGTIKVLKFNGIVFDDLSAPDITIPGFPANSVYDLTYDNAHQLLYACGQGFVASIDISFYCPSTLYSISAVADCATLSCVATVNPVPPVGTTVTYVIYNGTTEVASNSTGIFSSLTPDVNYTVKAFLNRDCGGIQVVTGFVLEAPPFLITNSPAAVCVSGGTADLTAPAVTAGSAGGLTFTYWSDAAATIPYTTPAAAPTGTYYIKAELPGGCPAIKAVVVPALPTPVADAGNDVTICFGQNTQLNGAGGVSYSWSPVTYLDNPNIANPEVINPRSGTFVYHLTVTDANGCRSLIDEQVTVTVTLPPGISITTDTIITVNQPLQLNAIDANGSGFVSYLWTPSAGLNDPFIPNPVAILDKDIIYTITATTASDCKGTATVRVKVYTGPEIYVPTAFTPGNDGLNDILKAIPVGMKEFHYFNIYNRWGQQVFTTSDPRQGWDGKIQGVLQASATFVWMIEAVDFRGNTIRRKGIVTLIR
ncbi:MAG TPA: gliding motility-associated C-terminal domain-containing protein [Chitinophagaceae bacterium]|nr:gliding motility-associated C-terminal domain-containing protein [Chitinophagaceae bacterium]HNU14838.1 gliding motility-associated C-terminal domain-containing protein [Chitinophagaceae bacterium]